MTKEFRANLSVQMHDEWTIDGLFGIIEDAVFAQDGAVGGSIRPEPIQEQEFYDNLVNEIANTIQGMELSGQESDETDKVYVWPQGAHNIAQYVVDLLTKDALI